MDFELEQNKRDEILQLVEKLDIDKCLLDNNAQEVFVSKYFQLTPDDTYLESVSTLHIGKEKVESRKIGNILFNLRSSIEDALKSVVALATNIHKIQSELQAGDISEIKMEKVVLFILNLILELRKLCNIQLDTNSAKVIIKLNELGAFVQGIDEEQLRHSLDEIADLDNILDNLQELGCISIREGKIELCETIKIDWMCGRI